MSLKTLSMTVVVCGAAACTPRSTVIDEKKNPMSTTDSNIAPMASTALATKTITIPGSVAPASHLAVLLHGVGADAASFQDIGRALGPALPHVEFLVPDGFHPFDGGGGRQWFSIRGITEETRPARVAESGAEVSQWIDSELARRGLSGDRLVVIGFSQGAIVASWLAMHRSPRPAAVVMLSGRVAEAQAPSPSSSIPVFIAHGERDAVMPVAVVEPGARVLEAWGLRVTTRIYPGLGHQVDAGELSDVRDFLQRAIGKT